MTLTISTIIPNHNDAPALARCLSSVFAQTKPPLEVVVIDDASTDDSRAVLEGFRSQHPSLRPIYVATKSPDWCRQLYENLPTLRGDYVHISGSDDCIAPNFYEI